MKNYSSGDVNAANNMKVDTKKFTGKPKLESNKDNNRRVKQKLRRKKKTKTNECLYSKEKKDQLAFDNSNNSFFFFFFFPHRVHPSLITAL